MAHLSADAQLHEAVSMRLILDSKSVPPLPKGKEDRPLAVDWEGLSKRLGACNAQIVARGQRADYKALLIEARKDPAAWHAAHVPPKPDSAPEPAAISAEEALAAVKALRELARFAEAEEAPIPWDEAKRMLEAGEAA